MTRLFNRIDEFRLPSMERSSSIYRSYLKTRLFVKASPYASPIVLVRKQYNSLRMCVDFRKINQKSYKDAYPLPRVEESFDALSGAKLFSTMHLTSGNHVVAMHEDDIEKTAFTTPFGLYEYLRMPFGLCNGPATFQRLMQHCFQDEILTFC
ncbi:unnamed protein product [Mytilus coruscus]|uniref:Reverse transcriptase domain-containing protein n=1 Tax=Mytilus coruscus TaxID=42192 RepID=A0A6J8B7M0_MYTCO|nr:unnamed protein product [Mytilus coruscus]